MAIYRTIHLSFWEDSKVTDDFTPEDRYFYLYLLTNTHTNITGCYEISYKQIARETGYNEETAKRLIKRFEKEHEVLTYDESTKEVLIWNWYKYNWTKSANLITGVANAAERIKSDELRRYVLEVLECVKNEEEYRRTSKKADCIETSIAGSDVKTVFDNKEEIKEIIDYLNSKLGTRYRVNNKQTKEYINARITEGYTLEDFYTVIDKKVGDWKDNPKMSDYLRPSTLFSTKFESYLNQVPKNEESSFGGWRNA